MTVLARELVERGHRVDILAGVADGAYRNDLPGEVGIVQLGRNPVQMARSIISYCATSRDAVLISAQQRNSIVAGFCKRMGFISNPLIVREPNAMHASSAGVFGPLWQMMTPFSYRSADAFIAVTKYIADEIHAKVPSSVGHVNVIGNAVDTVWISSRSEHHPSNCADWLEGAGSIPVILAAGRLVDQKGFDILLQAFAQARAAREMKLIILGEGRLRPQLEHLARKLMIQQDVAMPGFVDNPHSFMARASLFVLSSRFEGSPNVLLEALACDCQVVSTDCPSGPREILGDIDWGRLVPVDDPCALGESILEALAHPPGRGVCREYVEDHYNVSAWADRYISVVNTLNVAQPITGAA